MTSANSPDHPDHSERPERSDRPERSERPERSDRPERPERSDRPERPERPARSGPARRASPVDSPVFAERPPRVDALQFSAWIAPTFSEMRAGGLDAIHATVCYHETFRETAVNIGKWRRRFRARSATIRPGRSAADIVRARATGRTAVFFGAQSPSAMDGDISLIPALRELGLVFMQLTYNNQSLLGGGCQEGRDAGLTRMGREALAEMNRFGMIADLSHAGPRTCLEAIEASARPVAITHANPRWWHESPRNISHESLQALAERGGVIGLSLYPHHLRDGPQCSLESFCDMAAKLRDEIGVKHIGIGSDLCRGRPPAALQWMREGRWTLSRGRAKFPPQPKWFESAADFPKLEGGLLAAGFSREDAGAVLGGNWTRFLAEALSPQ